MQFLEYIEKLRKLLLQLTLSSISEGTGSVGSDPLILSRPLSLPLVVFQLNYLVGANAHLPILS